MSNLEANAQARADEFSAVVLEALTEVARRTLREHQQRGALVAVWNDDEVEWVAAEEQLRRLSAAGKLPS